MIHITPPPLSPQSMDDLLCTIMLLCRGTRPNGTPFWAYMCVKPSMAQAFKEVRDRGGFNLEDYGTILESGAGTEIPPEVQKRMERDYGINHSYEAELLAAAARIEQDKL